MSDVVIDSQEEWYQSRETQSVCGAVFRIRNNPGGFKRYPLEKNLLTDIKKGTGGKG